MGSAWVVEESVSSPLCVRGSELALHFWFILVMFPCPLKTGALCGALADSLRLAGCEDQLRKCMENAGQCWAHSRCFIKKS